VWLIDFPIPQRRWAGNRSFAPFADLASPVLMPVGNWGKQMAATICMAAIIRRTYRSSATRTSCCGLLLGWQLSSLGCWLLTLSGAAGGHAVGGGANPRGCGPNCSSPSVTRWPSVMNWSGWFPNEPAAKIGIGVSRRKHRADARNGGPQSLAAVAPIPCVPRQLQAQLRRAG
jgi:hypothetical protein